MSLLGLSAGVSWLFVLFLGTGFGDFIRDALFFAPWLWLIEGAFSRQGLLSKCRAESGESFLGVTPPL